MSYTLLFWEVARDDAFYPPSTIPRTGGHPIMFVGFLKVFMPSEVVCHVAKAFALWKAEV